MRHTLQRVLDDGDDALKLLRGEVTGALGQIDIGLLAHQVGVAATDTLDLGQGVHDLLLAIDVCVQQTDDVLEAAPSQQSSPFPSLDSRRSPALIADPMRRSPPPPNCRRKSRKSVPGAFRARVSYDGLGCCVCRADGVAEADG